MHRRSEPGDGSMSDAGVDVSFEFDARSVGKLRCEVDVTMIGPFEEKATIATGEGPAIGGDGTAPSPLALFTGALAGCMMSQLRTFSKRLEVPIAGSGTA
jgi:uncharacterized OsmC-like protein